ARGIGGAARREQRDAPAGELAGIGGREAIGGEDRDRLRRPHGRRDRRAAEQRGGQDRTRDPPGAAPAPARPLHPRGYLGGAGSAGAPAPTPRRGGAAPRRPGD